jgi:phosphoglycerate dehydrogenase-like enzyme
MPNSDVRNLDRVAVTSRAFSRNLKLREELLRKYSHVTFNDSGRHLSESELVEFLRGHNKVILSLEPLTDTVLRQLPELEVISKYGVGLDNLDLEAVAKHGKRLGWVGGVNRRSVSELVLCMALSLVRKVMAANQAIRAGDWKPHIGNQMSGKTVGIVGCGNIGKDLVKLLQPFQCDIIVYDIRRYPEFYAEHRVSEVSLNTLFSSADLISLHVPYDASTHMLVDQARLDLMKPNAILINTARGKIVDEQALKQSLINGKIGGAAFDVFSVEPPQDHDLLRLPNFLATPHMGGSAEEAILAMGRVAIDGLEKAVPISDLESLS